MQQDPAVLESNSQHTEEYLYHATYRPLLKSIRSHGLGGDKAQAKWEDSKPGVVYLAIDPNVAESYAESSDVVPEDWLDEIVIIKIAASKLDQSRLFIDQNVQDNAGDTLEYHGVIPMDSMSLTENFADGRNPQDRFSTITWRHERRKLNVPALINAGAILVTYPHTKQGWDTDNKEDWSYSLISLYNVLQGGWPSEAKQYLKPESYKKAEQQINSSAPNLGSDQLVYDGKYNQILWSIKKLGIPDKVAFLDDTQDMNENFADGKNPQDKGDSKRHGINTKASVSSLRKTAKQGGRKGQLSHWLANMKSGRAKAKKKTNEAVIGNLHFPQLTIAVDDHSIDRTRTRGIDPHTIDQSLKKLNAVADQLAQIEPNAQVWAYDAENNLGLGLRRISSRDMLFKLKTVVADRPFDGAIPIIELS